MSDEELVKVNCNHSGKFKTVNGVLLYVNGVVDVVHVDHVSIFSDLMLKLLDKGINLGRIWYKLPFDDLVDRIPLWENGDVNKKKMQAAGHWMKELDLYVEKLAELNIDIEKGVIVTETQSASDEDEDPEYVPQADDGGTSDDEVVDEEVGLSENGESGDEDDVVEADIELFNHDNYEDQIPDEDDVYPATDDSSGDEEEQAERLVRRNVLDGLFSLKQLFSSGKEFKQNVIRYVLKTRRNVVNDRWEKEKLAARCKGKGCNWFIYCAVENPIGKWMVKRFDNEHTCHPVGRCELIKSHVVADLFLEDIRRDPHMSAPEIKDEIKRRYNIIITPAQSQFARRRVFDMLQAEYDEQFARLRDYGYQLTKTMPSTTVEINTTTREDGKEEFAQIYICFEPLRTSWKQNCRPIIGLDGTFLKHNIQGVLLTAVGRDPNNQIYPIAWAVVSGENHDNWWWFIQKLKIDLDLGDGEGFAIISDMHRSIIHGMAMELPRAEHRACARHIYGNVKKNHKSDTLKPLFWRVASSYNEADFKTNLAVFREMVVVAGTETFV